MLMQKNFNIDRLMMMQNLDFKLKINIHRACYTSTYGSYLKENTTILCNYMYLIVEFF